MNRGRGYHGRSREHAMNRKGIGTANKSKGIFKPKKLPTQSIKLNKDMGTYGIKIGENLSSSDRWQLLEGLSDVIEKKLKKDKVIRKDDDVSFLMTPEEWKYDIHNEKIIFDGEYDVRGFRLGDVFVFDMPFIAYGKVRAEFEIKYEGQLDEEALTLYKIKLTNVKFNYRKK